MKIGYLAICFAGLGLVLYAQDDADYTKWMKTAAGEMGALRKIDSKTGPEAAASADKIAEAYQHMSMYWSGKSADDAVKLADAGKAAAVALWPPRRLTIRRRPPRRSKLSELPAGAATPRIARRTPTAPIRSSEAGRPASLSRLRSRCRQWARDPRPIRRWVDRYRGDSPVP